MNDATFIAVISGIVSIVTIFGVKVWDSVIKKQEDKGKMQGKEFDDGVERRKELIKEIERLNGVITQKDEHIGKMQEALDKAREAIAEWAVKYTKLEGNYINALEDLQRLSGDVTEKVSMVKHDMINQRSADMLEDELREKGVIRPTQ